MKPSNGSPNPGAVYIVAGSSGWATFRVGYHPAMYFDELEVGSLVLDVDGDRLDAKFLRETGAIDDHFTIIKGGAPEPLRIVTFRRVNGQTVIQWKSIAGKRYQVLQATDLTLQNWNPVSGAIRATGATTSWIDATPGNTASSFYQINEVGE